MGDKPKLVMQIIQPSASFWHYEWKLLAIIGEKEEVLFIMKSFECKLIPSVATGCDSRTPEAPSTNCSCFLVRVIIT